ncbi:uncharacterized protein EI90DRAFT_1950293 [Cantharellus anzutake]|uniref:uncharacterized protein n=1 Tax=Cantharellus anzutake TaxID=1750568 RepID=UPI001904EEA4|nr:uncharacterized protein EI90DRAFT_1950293 [Cantharellus anzutake]KAF8326397.1 hypothetical protein EI90DRAFT_1950293 [Cantharellus anzutake]
MPSNQPMWHCYECNAEMRPLMVPDPHCASCNGTFVEMIENPDDDPRNFQVDVHHHHDHDGPLGLDPLGQQDDGAIGTDQALRMFQIIMGGVGGPQRRASIRIDRRTGNEAPDPAGDFRLGGGPSSGIRTSGFVWTSTGGGRRIGDGERSGIDSLPPFGSIFYGVPMSPGIASREREELGGPPPFLRHLLMNILGPPGGNGQFGDYVLDNEALDQILTHLMEQSQGDKPVPASDEMIAQLPRGRVTPGSNLLENECAICKDSFEVQQETISLPCKHIFHDECILPWIRQSGTCPVCRYELVPQPRHGGPHISPNGGGGNGSSTSHNSGARQSDATSSSQRFIPGGWEGFF